MHNVTEMKKFNPVQLVSELKFWFENDRKDLLNIRKNKTIKSQKSCG